MAINRIYDNTGNYAKLSSMKRINSAKDNPAGLVIAEGMKAQAKENEILADGAGRKKNMLNVADGGLESISNSLQRMRELSLQAGSFISSRSDRAAIQQEIDQLKEEISGVASNTEFNTKNLLDGSENGTNGTLKALGLENFDVTSGKFDISKIDSALDTINSQRGSIGAQSNGLDSSIAYNKLSGENLTSAFSKIEDLNVEKTISDRKKEDVIDQYRVFVEQAKQKQENGALRLFN